jgi:imidazolonepropionase-like amidohydrolase
MEGAPPGIKLAMGENPKRSGATPAPGVERRYPATRMGVLEVMREAFVEARAYQETWRRYEAERATAAKRKRGADPIPPRRDLRLEPLVEVLEGKRLVHAHSYRADEILQLLRLAEELGFRIATLQHVLEGYRVADEIAAHGAGASTFSDRWAYKVEAWEAIPYNAALLHDRGVVVSINSDSAEEMRHLNQEAAKAMKWGGLSERDALALVTLNPAIQLGIEDRVGSIERGKDADLVVYDRHPLSVYAVVQKTLVDGRVLFDREADLRARAALDAERAELVERLQAKPDPDSEPDPDPELDPTGVAP